MRSSDAVNDRLSNEIIDERCLTSLESLKIVNGLMRVNANKIFTLSSSKKEKNEANKSSRDSIQHVCQTRRVKIKIIDLVFLFWSIFSFLRENSFANGKRPKQKTKIDRSFGFQRRFKREKQDVSSWRNFIVENLSIFSRCKDELVSSALSSSEISNDLILLVEKENVQIQLG